MKGKMTFEVCRVGRGGSILEIPSLNFCRKCPTGTETEPADCVGTPSPFPANTV